MVIDKQLKNDCVVIGKLTLCHVLLMKDANYPWLILVPDRNNIEEIYQLTTDDQQQLMRESTWLAEEMMSLWKGDKMNVAALGNVVSQLHVHHVIRRQTDIAWPTPVWGKYPAKAYTDHALTERCEEVRYMLENYPG